MEERGILSRERERGLPGETCGLKGFQVGGRADLREPQVPQGLSQLPRPTIIRLSGATISVNVPDSELGESKQGQLARRYRCGESAPPIPSSLMPPPPRNIASYTMTWAPNVYSVI